MPELLNFTKENQELINEGRKICTARREIYNDPRVTWVVRVRLIDVRNHLFEMEGYGSPEEFERVWRGIHRGHFITERKGKPVYVYVHFGDFRTPSMSVVKRLKRQIPIQDFEIREEKK